MTSPKNIKVWHPCNIYHSAKIGDDVSIGMFTEIGNNVVIGNNVRIGKGCFIPEGVTIQDDCFIGPHVCFTNDKYPPSPKDKWEKTVVGKGANLGAAVTIVCGVHIGEDAMIGAGSVVTKNIPAHSKAYGVPAEFISIGNKHGITKAPFNKITGK